MDITVKSVPDEVYRAIKREAKQQGRSLNAEIIRILKAVMVEAARRRRLAALRRELDRFAESLPKLDDSTSLVRADRGR